MAGLSLRLGLGLQRPAMVQGGSPVAPSNTVLPVVSGNLWVGQTLSTTHGTWDDNGSEITGYTYQWKRGGANISAATASTYLLVADDAGQNITCTVTATNAGGSTPATSGAAAICADQHWANIVLLCGFNGTDGATSSTDESIAAHTLTFNGDAQIDTAQSKFGGASLLLDGTGDYVTAADSADWNFTAEFTIEAWVRTPAPMSNMVSISQYITTGNNRSWAMEIFSDQLRFIYSTTGSDANIVEPTGDTVSAGTWYTTASIGMHPAICGSTSMGSWFTRRRAYPPRCSIPPLLSLSARGPIVPSHGTVTSTKSASPTGSLVMPPIPGLPHRPPHTRGHDGLHLTEC